MANEYIRKQDAIELCNNPLSEQSMRLVPPVDVVPYSIEPDGTLTVTVPKGTKRIGRILIEEDGTQYGGLFYPDTGGCFLSSMERNGQDG